jgi:SET domain-containing protein
LIDPENLVVRRSRAGLGLFTTVDIAKGARVAEYVGKMLWGDEHLSSNSLYLFEISSRRTIDGSPRWNLARYINHSCRPNCEAVVTARGRVFIQARRRIRAGEELAYNYGKPYWEDLIKPKGCRCEKCDPPFRRAAAAQRYSARGLQRAQSRAR